MEMMTKTLLTVMAFILALSYVDATETADTTSKSQIWFVKKINTNYVA